MKMRESLKIGILLNGGESAPYLLAQVRHIESMGLDKIWITELNHDPFILAASSFVSTQSIQIGTGVAIALARNPYSVAMMSQDLQSLSGQRFLLGLGTQTEVNIRKRFSMPWSGKGVEQLQDFLNAFHAIWDSWESGSRLNYRGPVYKHVLDAPVFMPKMPPPRPLIALGGQGKSLLHLAGRVADSFISHPFGTDRTLEEFVIPNLREGAKARSASSVDSFPNVIQTIPIATGSTREEIAASVNQLRQDIAFHAATPSYRHILDTYGWGDLLEELMPLVVRRKWDELAEALPREVLETFVVIGHYDELEQKIRNRISLFADEVVLTGAGLVMPTERQENEWLSKLVENLRKGTYKVV